MSTPSTPQRASISAFIVCHNEEKQIRRCLESVRWCDEIVIVDSGSTDSTLTICKEFTGRIFHRDWTGYVEQKSYGLLQCTSEWVVNLDADEEVSPGLRDQILDALVKDRASAENGNRINGYFISRVVFFLNRYWKKGGWYPEYRLRVCRRSATLWGGVDPHEKAIVSGKTGKLNGDLFHYTYSSFTDQVRRINTLSSNAAVTLHKRGAKAKITDIAIRPFFRVFKFYFLKRGYREGIPGFIVAWLEGLQVMLKYVKLWEMEKIRGE